MLRTLLEASLMPPLNCLLLAVLGLVLSRKFVKTGRGLMVGGAVLLWLQATPYLSTALLCSLQTEPALDPEVGAGDAQAIVVLSADVTRHAPEYGRPTSGAFGLERVRYGAWLQRATGLPMLVSGGVPARGFASLAETMQKDLGQSFDVPVRWIEPRSADTYQNARESAEILERDGVKRILLVTHAWHMPRSRAAFEACGMEVVPAPTSFRSYPQSLLAGLVPRWTALRDWSLAGHEYLGMVWYELVHY